MDFELTDEQLELQRVVRDVVDSECPPALVRAVVEGSDDGDGFWKTLVQMELPGLAVPTEHGGTGATAVELVITLEELGRGADPSPMLATTSQYVPLVLECGGDKAGPLLAAVCAGGSGAASFEPGGLSATADGDSWVLSGTVRGVMDGDRADEIALVATTAAGPGVFVVPSSSVTAVRTSTLDNALHLADLALEAVRVPADRSFTGPGVAAGIARAHEEAVTGIAAVTVGASQRILELVVDHVKSRKQFGVAIGSFQAVKHMAADLYVAIERARALHQFAALTIAEDDDRRHLAASMAKAAAGDCQRIAVQHGIQLFGGLGFTWENDLQIFVRRAKAGELLFGGSAAHRALVAAEVLGA